MNNVANNVAVLEPTMVVNPPAAPATAVLSAHRGAHEVQLVELERFATPVGTGTWHPVPHMDIPRIIEEAVLSRGWSFAQPAERRFRVAVTDTGSKLFGVTEILIPGYGDCDFGLALGFRNSHDMSFAFRLTVGQHVFVCDNMCFSGDITGYHKHTSGIDVRVLVAELMLQVPEAARGLTRKYDILRRRLVSPDTGVAILAKAVDAKALPVAHFMDARAAFLGTFDGTTADIYNGGTLWAVFQAVTATWKKCSLMQVPQYSTALHAVIDQALGQSQSLVPAEVR